jgi:S1-C subfamily serine protease
MRRLPLIAAGLLVTAVAAESPRARGARPAPATTAAPVRETALGTEQLAARARDSVVRIRSHGRDASGEGVGTGFVVDAAGLIATSLHVIGEARPFDVQFPDGSGAAVTAIHAWDRASDLAILRVDRTGLTALPLGFSAWGVLTSSSVRAAFRDTPLTAICLAVGLSLNALGWWWMRRLVMVDAA